MGFRPGAFATVWSVDPQSETRTKIRISISHRPKDAQEYVQDFSGFVTCAGSAVAKKAAKLKKGDRIKLGDIDVQTKYVKEKDITYTNFFLFGFSDEGNTGGGSNNNDSTRYSKKQQEVGDGNIDDSSGGELPW